MAVHSPPIGGEGWFYFPVRNLYFLPITRNGDLTMKIVSLLFVLLISSLLTGCAAPLLFAGGIATGAMVADDRRSTGAMLYDEGIELDARKALDSDARLHNAIHTNITSFNSIVLLSGEAPTTIMRYRAETLVREVPHVRLVYNEMTIGPPSSMTTRSADTIATVRVKGEISANKYVDANHVKVVTENGVVFLMGMVNHSEADQATESARAVSGVAKVVRLFELID
ncbi:hyperosmotically inducible periplasmic protein [Gammaproteobacteria bacterium]